MGDTLLAVYGIEHTTPAFQRAVIDMTGRIGGNADYWLAVMSFETGGTFDPAVRNPISKAVGLIQFTKETAENILGTTRDELADMSQVEQLQWVEKYLAPATGKFDTIADHYMAVFAPIGMGEARSFGLYHKDAPTKRGRDRYTQNAKLDSNNDGVITVGEAARRVERIVNNAPGRIDVPDEHPATDAAPVVGGLLGLLLFILGIRKFKRLGRIKS